MLRLIWSVAMVFIVVVSVVGMSLPSSAAPADLPLAAIQVPHAESVVLVGFVPGTPAAEKAGVRRAAGAVNAAPLSSLATDAEKLSLGPGVTVEQALANLQRNPNVRYAEPDYLVQETDTADDPYYANGSLWGMYGDATTPKNTYGSGAGEVWAEGYTGSLDVYVGVIDEGIEYDHTDLEGNVWTNPYEIANDGIDNDGNGKVDDIHGWDFYYDDNSVYDGTMDDHATHVAGTIGGKGGNDTGVAGVNWQVTLISTKFLGPNGGYTSDAVAALDYLTDLKKRHGLNIVATNNSWGGGGFSQSLLDAINRSADEGILFVAAAGNNGRNTDNRPFYPACYQATTRYDNKQPRGYDAVIAVAATTSTGGKASFSNYGSRTVDIGAPGSGIYSTVPTNSYASYSGTSMATPHVTGAIALMASINPDLTAAQLRDTLIKSAAPTASLAGITVTGGRLDIGAMVDQVVTGPGNQKPIVNAQSVSTEEDTPVEIALSGSDPEGDNITFAVATGPAHGSLSGLDTSTGAVTYTPDFDSNGDDSFTFTASDGLLTSDPAKISITVNAVNDAPAADDQSVSAVAGVPKAITLSGSDVDSDSLTYSLIAGPGHGGLTGSAPTLTYTADAGYSGDDSFTFMVSDGTVDSAPATVSITVAAAGIGDFSLSTSPDSRKVKAGSTTNYSVSVTPEGGYSSVVALSVAGLPAGVSAVFSSDSLASGSTSLQLRTSKSTTRGTYSLTITGDGSDGTAHTVSVTLIVR